MHACMHASTTPIHIFSLSLSLSLSLFLYLHPYPFLFEEGVNGSEEMKMLVVSFQKNLYFLPKSYVTPDSVYILD